MVDRQRRQMLPRALREYITAFNVVAVCVYRDGRVGTTRDPPRDANIWWCNSRDAGRLVRHVRETDGGILAGARELGVPITSHATVLERASAAVQRIREGLSWAQRTGTLAAFNDEFRRRRLQAKAAGHDFMSYAQARAKLQRALAAVAAGRPTRALIAEVFDLPPR
jgi:hypothetical protein